MQSALYFQIVLAALVAAAYAKADADPYLLYGGYAGYAGLGYAGYHAAPYAFGKSAPCVNAFNQPTPCRDGYYGHFLHKRDAEAEPIYPLAYSGYAGYYAAPYAFGKNAPCVNAFNQPTPCAGGFYGHYLKKREAEAEPYFYGAYGLGYAGYHGLGYAGYHGLGYTHSSNFGACFNTYGGRVPC